MSWPESLRRHAALGAALLRARGRRFDPFKLTWILTERCSQRCRSCHLWAREAPSGPTLERIEHVLAANPQLTWLNLSGGDFVERDDAPEILRRAVEHLPDLCLLDFPTAGQDTEATLAALQPVLDSAVPHVVVTVSLDGPDDVHDRVRGSTGSARRARATYAALKAVRRRGFRVALGTTLSAHNLPEVPPADPLTLLPPGVPLRDLHLNLAHHSAHAYRNQDTVLPPVRTALSVVDALARARSWRVDPLEFLERRYWRYARPYLLSGRLPPRCGALRASVFLGADMQIYPCSIWERPLGDFAEVGDSLRRLGEFDAAHELRAGAGRACPGCWSPCEALPSLVAGGGRPL
ncbi:MAG: hypothetical protein DHS20C15_00940 [Planctomycetota bacterium]|nr:MAG: hypothetical protein DHS20C15_00940 [Planctomycetota bacterium]